MVIEVRQTGDAVLLLDIGNTNLKWSWLLDDQMSPVCSLSYRGGSMEQKIQDCWRGFSPPGQVLIASVAEAGVGDQLEAWMKKTWGLTPEFICSPGRGLGVTNGYTEPAQLGVDRWLTMVAVFNRKLVPACIVDCGTAVTLDVIDGIGVHLGGLILPGFRMMRTALLQHTSIPRQQAEFETSLFGRDTASAVTAGSVHAVAALMDRLRCEYGRRFDQQPRSIITGSDAPQLQTVLSEPALLEPDLVMSGLAMVAKERRG